MFVASIALALGIGGVMPSYTSAAVEQTESHVQIGQIVKGTVVENWGNEIIVKGDGGKRYHVGLHTFAEEQIQSMNILSWSIGANRRRSTGKRLRIFMTLTTL